MLILICLWCLWGTSVVVVVGTNVVVVVGTGVV